MKRSWLVLLILLFLTPEPGLSGWRSLDRMSPQKPDGNSLNFSNGDAIATVTAISESIIRVRFLPRPQFERDHSYAVIQRDFGDVDVRFEVGDLESTLHTQALRVTIQHDPWRVEIADAEGLSLDADDPDLGTAWAGTRVTVWKRLRDDEHIYGLGEKTGKFDKRGWKLGGSSYAMWNSDTYGYNNATDPLYASVPFYLVLRQGRAHGVFLDNTFRTHFDVGRQQAGVLEFGAAGGELDYYFIDGPTPKDVLRRYTDLTGRTPLPPRWALGFHQSRYSYFPESKVRFIAENLRQRRMPADAIWLDIDYQDGYRPFTWNRERFPDPAKLIGDLREMGLRVVTTVDPHPQKKEGYAVYDSGLAGDHFVKRADGSLYEAEVWPSQAEEDPGPSIFPDFSRPATRDWWGDQHHVLFDAGVSGIWNDMNEPAVFDTPDGTFPLDVQHFNEGLPSDHREVHNVYGLLMNRSTHEALLRLRPEERPFVLTRATFAGGQRYAAVWPGDNVSDWAALQTSLPMLLGMSLSGLGFIGNDIGGFVGTPSAELFTRWMQAAVFFPFMRAHTAKGTADQEPWAYGTKHERANRKALELRYTLLPTLYHAMWEMSTTGIPAMRPMLFEVPAAANAVWLDDQFFFGDDLLVDPILRPDAEQEWTWLPEGEWYAYASDTSYAGDGWRSQQAHLDTLPLYVRGGTFLFLQPGLQHTDHMANQDLTVRVYPAQQSERLFYEDDGISFAYREGQFLKRTFVQKREQGRMSVVVRGFEGDYRPADRNLRFEILAAKELAQNQNIASVQLDGEALPEAIEAVDQQHLPKAWWIEDERIVIKVPDRLEMTLIVEFASPSEG